MDIKKAVKEADEAGYNNREVICAIIAAQAIEKLADAIASINKPSEEMKAMLDEYRKNRRMD